MKRPKGLVHVTPAVLSTEQSHVLSLKCWCLPYRLPAEHRVIVHRKATEA